MISKIATNWILNIEGDEEIFRTSLNLSIKLKLALVIIIQRFSPTKVDNAKTLIAKPIAPIITPKIQLNHQLLDFNQHQPSQKACLLYTSDAADDC